MRALDGGRRGVSGAPLRIGLFYKHARLGKAGHGLAQWLLARFA